MREDGYTSWERLDFDLGIVDYVEAFETRMQRTREVPAPRTKQKPKMRVPYYTDEQRLIWLGIDPDEAREHGMGIDPEVDGLVDDLLHGHADWLYGDMFDDDDDEDESDDE